MKGLFWKIFYAQWHKRRQADPGYTILLMAPGDLPVFLKIADQVLRFQDMRCAREILVIPDRLSSGFLEVFYAVRSFWPKGQMRLVRPASLERALMKVFNSPWHNCWFQFTRGVEAAKTQHILWHDVDLFILPKDFLEKHYAAFINDNRSVLGVSRMHYDNWYAENGFDYLVHTWEAIFDVDWVKSYSPWQHRGHDFVLNGKHHLSDITLVPQCLTSPEKIGISEGRFVHFNHCICDYRKFINSKSIFFDRAFRILFIRLLIELFDRGRTYGGVPPLEELYRSLAGRGHGRISYGFREAATNYYSFRKQLELLMGSSLFSAENTHRLKEILRPFDKEYSLSS